MGNKRFDKEFKKEIVELCTSGGRTATSVANEIGVHVNTIYKWEEEYKNDPVNAFPGTGHLKPDQDETRRMQRRIKELEEENAILKKAAVYFAKNSK
jgi:transposase